MGAVLLLISVLSVHDGDTMTINLSCDIAEVCHKMPIRISGIDTPELHDRRPEIRALAFKAKTRAAELVAAPHKVEMRIVGRDKYFRLDADVYSDGVLVSDTLKAEGLARDYAGIGLKPW